MTEAAATQILQYTRTEAALALVRFVCGTIVMISLAATIHAQTKSVPPASETEDRPLAKSIQQALDDLADAELAREQAELLRQQDFTKIREQFRLVITQLRSIEVKLAAQLRDTYQLKPSQLKQTKQGQNRWTVRQLESMTRNLKVQLARAYRNQALGYPESSIDRINALTLALDQLAGILLQPIDDQGIWLARIEQVVCLRLLDKPAEARKNLILWQEHHPADRFASLLTGEMLRIELDESNVTKALAIVDLLQAKDPQSDTVVLETAVPETDDAILEVLLATRRLALADEADELTQRVIAQLNHIATAHGKYWTRRAQHQVGQAFAERPDTDDPQLLAYAAASLYTSGNLDGAVATYDRIARLHGEEKNADDQFEASRTAAAIVRESNKSDAYDRFQQLATQHPQHEHAAEVHLIAIGLAADLTKLCPPDRRNEAFERYLELLREHLQQWPKHATSQQVRQWLARTESAEVQQQRAQTLTDRGRREEAIALYRELLPDTSPEASNDAQIMEEFAKLLADGTDGTELREALRIWKQIEARSKPGGPRWWRGRRARLALLEQLGEGERAKKLQQLTKILYPADPITNSE